MTEKVKRAVNETVNRLTSEDSPYFKPIKRIGAGMAIAGIVIKVIGLIIPATMPVAVLSLAPELITVGLTLYGSSALTVNKEKTNPSVTTGLKGWKKIKAILKNII